MGSDGEGQEGSEPPRNERRPPGRASGAASTAAGASTGTGAATGGAGIAPASPHVGQVGEAV